LYNKDTAGSLPQTAAVSDNETEGGSAKRAGSVPESLRAIALPAAAGPPPQEAFSNFLTELKS